MHFVYVVKMMYTVVNMESITCVVFLCVCAQRIGHFISVGTKDDTRPITEMFLLVNKLCSCPSLLWSVTLQVFLYQEHFACQTVQRQEEV